MTSLLAACFATPFFCCVYARMAPVWSGPLLPLVLAVFGFFQAADWGAPERLLFTSLWMLYALKGWALTRHQGARTAPFGYLLLYAYVWPGVDPAPFMRRGEPQAQASGWFVQGWILMVLGLAGLGALALLGDPSGGWLGLACLLTAIHLGYSDVLSALLRLAGFPVKRLFNNPLASRTLNEFWTLRWNRPFVEMNRLLWRPLVQPLGGWATVPALFFISGLLHELALSFPVGSGWGGPLVYFALHGGLMVLEKRSRAWKVRLQGRLWTLFWLLAPAPLLFHSGVREQLVLPLLEHLHSLPAFGSPGALLAAALHLAAWGHFLVLVASFQVPHRLGWKTELQLLRPLNRKLLWTYGGYIVGMITTWGWLTLQLAPEMLAGERTARYLVALIAVFWWSRIIVDTFYFEHSDWPEGPEFVLGHTCLTTLFVFIASTYTCVFFLAPLAIGAVTFR